MTRLNVEKLTLLKMLLSVDGIGPGKVKTLLAKFSSVENIFSAATSELIEVTGIQKNLAKRIHDVNLKKEQFSDSVKKEIDKAAELNIDIISIWDDEYPDLLKKIFDPPFLLYKKGKFF